MMSFESNHAIKKKNKGKHGTCVVNLDMHKAYDRAKRNYLERILLHLGFTAYWVSLIMCWKYALETIILYYYISIFITKSLHSML